MSIAVVLSTSQISLHLLPSSKGKAFFDKRKFFPKVKIRQTVVIGLNMFELAQGDATLGKFNFAT